MLPESYGCVVANRFGNLLDDDADPFDLINDVEKEKENEKKKKKKEDDKKGKQKKNNQKESQKDRRVPVASDIQDPVPGQHQMLAFHYSKNTNNAVLADATTIFLDWIVQPRVCLGFVGCWWCKVSKLVRTCCVASLAK